MRILVYLASLLLTALVQVTVAPLFPLGAATPDFALIAVMALAIYEGPHPAMVAIPFLAVMIGFASDRSPALLLLAYLPLLPFAYLLEVADLPLNRYAQSSVVVVIGGMAARLILSLGPLLQGADFTIFGLLKDLLLPGMLLDWVMLTVVFIPLRILGQEARQLTLARSRY